MEQIMQDVRSYNEDFLMASLEEYWNTDSSTKESITILYQLLLNELIVNDGKFEVERMCRMVLCEVANEHPNIFYTLYTNNREPRNAVEYKISYATELCNLLDWMNEIKYIMRKAHEKYLEEFASFLECHETL